ncbi:unnamed protein product [Symbiodinium sp. CCMP2592]|nr:unnamed protein product [Symbiodinium sp. CCMP2592]
MDLVVVADSASLAPTLLGGPLVVWSEATGGECALLAFAADFWLLGLACGCCFSAPTAPRRQTRPLRGPLDRWAAVSRRALFFLGRRRRISLAFGHYREVDLRNTAGSRPNAARRARRASTPRAAGLLYEGPALATRAPLATMDPTEAERDIGPRRRPLETAIKLALGQPQRVREIVLIPRPSWDAAIAALKVIPLDADGAPEPARDPTLVELARLESVRRVSCLRMGVTPDSPGAAGPSAPTPAMVAAGPASPSGGRKLKLSAILDPTLDADVVVLEQTETQTLYTEYKKKYGDFPSHESDPSLDQLSALKQVLQAGAAPYTDFSLFGPHGLRLLRKQSFTAYVLNVSTGEWTKKEQPGPGSFHAWYEAWKVYRTAMLLLEVVDSERLDSYAEHVRSFLTQFGDSAWWLIYKAENRLRCEHLERLRRRLHDQPDFGYTPARPWNAAFAAAVKDMEFWTRELVTPATLWLSGTSGPPRPAIPPPSQEEEPNPRPGKAKRKYTGDDHSEKEGNVFVKNRRGAGGGGATPSEPSRATGGSAGAPQAATSAAGKATGPKDYFAPTPKIRSGAAARLDDTAELIRRTAASKAALSPPPLKRKKPDDPPRDLGRQRPRPGSERKSTSSQVAHLIPPSSHKVPLYRPMDRGPRAHGTWLEKPGEASYSEWRHNGFGEGPSWLADYGFLVCALDKRATEPTDLLDEPAHSAILRDLVGRYAVFWAAPPCGTFSPLREVRPGPPVLRSEQHIEGLPSLGKKEKEQVRTANLLIERCSDSVVAMWDLKLTWGVENSDHPVGKPSLWAMPSFRAIIDLDRVGAADFDQCRFGLETVKPTRFLFSAHVDFAKLHGQRCNHPRGTQSVAGRQVSDSAGHQRWASANQAEYTAHLSQIIAEALYQGAEFEALPSRGPQTEREAENERALGGLRNPRRALTRLPRSAAVGIAIRRLLSRAVDLWPELLDPAVAILRGEEPADFSPEAVSSEEDGTAATPIQASVLEAWGDATDDPDAKLLAHWLDHGAPLGIEQAVPTTGVFIPVSRDGQMPAWQLDRRALEGWKNYPSAEAEEGTLRDLLDDYVNRGFCVLVATEEEAEAILGGPPVLNRLGVIAKDKTDAQGRPVRKARVIWDLRESRVNLACCQGERILLPRLLDVVSSLLRVYREGGKPYLAGLYIKDAFMNVPAGPDRKFTAAAVPWGIVLFNTPAVADTDPQCYVDDPVFVMFGPGLGAAARDLAITLLWVAVTGFPTKLNKANGGKTIEWVGAKIECDDEAETVTVTIPEHKVKQLLADTNKLLSRPVIGARELRSYAGSMSFIAGLVPHLRPFLSTFWSALSTCGLANDGRPARKARNLIHTKRVAPGLKWIRALLVDNVLQRIFFAKPAHTDVEIVTDASPWGIGGIMRVGGKPTEIFYSNLPDELLKKFSAERGVSKFNTLWEGVALLVAFRLWLPNLSFGAVYRAKSDNLGFLRALSRGSAKSATLNVLAREFSLDVALRSYQVRGLAHIPGISNIQADALSRLFSPEPKHFPPELEHVPARTVDLTEAFWKVV